MSDLAEGDLKKSGDGSADNDASNVAVDLEQLQLIQLCFGEHEFGVAFESDAPIDLQESVEETKDESRPEWGGDVLAFEFDPVQFVQEKLCHGVPLDILCRDLETYSTFLKDKILRHVNTDVHDAFVKVSGHLVGMQDELRCVLQPVLGAVKKVEDAMAMIAQLEEVVNRQIRDASEVELVRLFDVNFLKLLLLYNLLCERLDALPPCLHPPEGDQQQHPHVNIKRISPSEETSLAAGSTHVRAALHEVAATLQQLKTLNGFLSPLTQRSKELEEASEIIRDSTQRSHRVFAQAYLALHWAYMEAPRVELTESLRGVMGLYHTAGEVQEFCRMYREQVLRPLLDQVLSWRAATQARHSLEDTIKLLEKLREELKTDVLCFAPLLREVFGGAVLPIPMIIWPIVCEALVKKMVSLYDVGIADAFRQRYNAAHEVLALMESNCASSEELSALMQSPDVALWRHKWNTDVYGTMRANELTKTMDDAVSNFLATLLKEDREAQNGGEKNQEERQVNSDRFLFSLFSKLKEALVWLFSPSTYIHAVAPKFLRETANVTRIVMQSVLQHIKSLQATSAMREWLSCVMGVAADLNVLAEYFEGPFRLRLEEVNGQTFAVSSPYIQLLSQDLCRAYAASLHRLVQVRVAEECSAGLQNIRSVKSVYSHTRRPLPTASSWYVASIVEPLHRFHEVSQSILPGSAHHTMMIAVVEDVANRFRTLAKDTLIAAKKTEESWEKLRRRKETTAGSRVPFTETPAESAATATTTTMAMTRLTQETASDRDKMVLQLYLDAKAFISEVEEMLQEDITCEKFPLVASLFKLLGRANWILGEDMTEPPDIDEVEV